MGHHGAFNQHGTGDDITRPMELGCILAVDDEESMVRLEEQMLESLGYEVVATHCSTDALAKFHSEPDRFDLVITDMSMPNMTGEELTRSIRSIERNVPIILCTGSVELIDEKRAKSIGITAYLRKPFTFAKLAQTVCGVMGREIERP